MSKKCFFWHDWDGCKCNKCGAERDEGHETYNCEYCGRCGKHLPGIHDWRGCKCAKCKRVDHEWKGGSDGRCRKCGERAIELNTYSYFNKAEAQTLYEAISGTINKEAVASVLYKIFNASYLFNFADDKTACSSGECGNARLVSTGDDQTCPVCRRIYRDDHFDASGRHKVAVILGEALWDTGGLPLMESVARLFPDRTKAYNVSHAWDCIGKWRA